MITCGVLILVVAVIIFFNIPYSKTKNNFTKDVKGYIAKKSSPQKFFTEQEMASLPEPVQKHLRICGYIDTPMMTSMTVTMPSVPLIDSKDKPPMNIDYTLFYLANEPVRLAYIKTSMYGIPFEAYDSTQNGLGFMKGVLGKVFTLFDHKGAVMDKGQLLTYLGECFLVPSSVFNGYITWEAVDSRHVKAAISYKGISGSGVFAFDDAGFLESFTTDERGRTGTDGSVDYPLWSGVYGNYTETNGIFFPARIKAVYNDEDGELVYFDANVINSMFQY
jgi:hypothetical protein